MMSDEKKTKDKSKKIKVFYLCVSYVSLKDKSEKYKNEKK